MSKVALGLVVVLFALLLLVVWPLAVIWSINTLFGTNIPMNLHTWVAVAVLVSVLRLSFPSQTRD